jgi:signal transduction histidine kinase
MDRIFEFGFTTKTSGQGGFGLHTSALAAGLMGGSLCAQSDGPGTGATFILELPVAATASEASRSGVVAS